MTPVLELSPLNKQFTLHTQGGRTLEVLQGIELQVSAGECLSLQSPSGSGKSTILRCITGHYLPGPGSHVLLRPRVLADRGLNSAIVDLAQASLHTLRLARQFHIAYVSQFLRVIPRVSTFHLVMQPMLREGLAPEQAEPLASGLLERLHLPSALWPLAPKTFSGGEQQRVNIAIALAACLVRPRELILLDEPTASLDQANRDVVTSLLKDLRDAGAAMIGAFHDHDTHERLATRTQEVH
jgi:alpha-D-ribose 1-methylphosphonate 5-triphosphate synthase subunit PhnL